MKTFGKFLLIGVLCYGGGSAFAAGMWVGDNEGRLLKSIVQQEDGDLCGPPDDDDDGGE